MDNDKQHIDTEFIDQSWQHMSQLLDKEMPVQKRKRRFIWLWFLGIATLALSIGLYQYNLSIDENIDKEIITNPIEKIAQKEDKSIDNQLIIENEKIATASQNNSKNKQTATNFINKNTALKNKSFSASKTSATNVTNSIFETKKSGLSKATLPLLSTDIKLKGNNSESTLKVIIPKTKVISDNQKWTDNYLAALPLPSFPQFYKERPVQIIQTNRPITKKVSKSKWRFGLYTGTMTNKLGSFRAGIHSNLALSAKWTLHIGLGYAAKNKNNASGNNAGNDLATVFTNNDNKGTTGTEENEDKESDPMGSPIPSLPDPAPNGIPFPITDLEMDFNYIKFHYFELPILFQYQFKPKWTLDFGGQIALLQGYKYQQAGESFFTTDLAAFNQSNTRTVDNNNGIINDINFAAIAGISYKISPKFSAYSNYHFSNNYLKNTPTNNALKERWQQIEVGVRYYIK